VTRVTTLGDAAVGSARLVGDGFMGGFFGGAVKCSANSCFKTAQSSARSKRRRHMSAAGRRKLSRLLKQRWAQGKMKRAKASKPGRRMSRAARKRIAAAQRARWAKVKAQQQAEKRVA